MKKKNFKELTTNKKIMLNIVLLVLIILLIFVLVYNFKLTKLERVKINDFDKKTSIFMEEYSDYEDDGKYISYAIEYLNSKYNKNEYSVDEVIDIINSTFNVSYTKQKIYKIGITVRMLEKGIVFDDVNGVYKYNSEKTRSDISETPIIKYELKKIKKKSKNRFVLTYNKYEVKDPYKILNYYNSLEKVNNKKLNIIVSYLKGNSNISNVKSLITEKNINNFGKKIGTKKVTLIIKNKNLVIDKIK